MIDVKHLLKDHAYQNIPLAYDEAYELGMYALKGCHGDPLAQIQSITVLSALHTEATYAWRWSQRSQNAHCHKLPEDAAEQIAGVCAAIFDHDIATSAFGFLNPNVPYAMDNCGMGGDLIVTANVSTLAAFIAAAAGIPMCKHGSPANADSGRHGSSDFIAMLGIDTYADRNTVEACVEEENFGYTEALDVRYKCIHMQTHKVAMLPHMNDIIGPITNPLQQQRMTRRVLGVNHLVSPVVVARAYMILNDRGVTHLEHAIIVRGFADLERHAGMDECSIAPGGTQVAILRDGEVSEHNWDAQHFGVQTVDALELSPPCGMSKGEFSLRILKGEVVGPPLAMVLVNAALLFYLAERSDNMKQCYKMALEVHESKAAYHKALAVSARMPKREGVAA